MPQLHKAADGLEITEAEDGLVIYQVSTDKVHHLNNTAAVVFSLCDGSRDVAQIAEELGKLFTLEKTPDAEAKTCLKQLLDQGLIV
jgi:hypothetical protein